MAAVQEILKRQKTVKKYFKISKNYKFLTVKYRYKPSLLYCGIRNFATNEKEKFDVLVIGGGSGGISCAKQASSLNASVCVIDYVTPSPQGSSWGMGGTCINVGCVPKKLMHQAALLGESIHEAAAFGWNIKDKNNITVDWDRLKEAIQDHIKSVNWVTRVLLKEKKIEYVNGFGQFVDPYTVEVKVKDRIRRIRGENIVIAIGGRPKYPNIPGAASYGISSDDIFALQKPPGKTLVIGAGYVALECAGFLNAFRYPISVMVRSVVLRNFDRQMAALVQENMEQRGITFIHKAVPKEIKKTGDKLVVVYENVETKKVYQQTFDNVFFAIGRKVMTQELNIKAAQVKIDENSGKIITDNERTNVPHIYAVGDVVHGKPELSPVAIEAGRLLAARLFGKSKELMDYENVATTIFSPLEYGCVGLSEESAIQKYGEEKLEVYHAYFKPLEFTIPQKSAAQCYLKVICLRYTPRTILGMHFVGPTAGEVIQGYAAAMKCKITIDQLMATVAIHPTVAEEFTRLYITKRSGLDPTPQSCCY